MGTNEQHPNITLLMQTWEAFNRNDLETVNKMVSEDVVYKVSGRGPVSGIYGGRLEFMKLLEKVKELSGGTVTVRPIVTLADDEYVFVLARVTGRRDEKILDIEHCYLYRVSNGRLVEGRTMPVDLYEFDEFWKQVSSILRAVKGDGKATPINIPMNKPETPTLWIWLTTIILSLVVIVGYVKKRKRHTEINS